MTAWLPSWERKFYFYFRPPVNFNLGQFLSFAIVRFFGCGIKPVTSTFEKTRQMNFNRPTCYARTARIIFPFLSAIKRGGSAMIFGGLFTFYFFLFPFSPLALANNLSITSATISEQNTSAQTAQVRFNISWDHSWNSSFARDAVWVFIKYSTDSGATWNHATLKTAGSSTPAGFSIGSGSTITIVVPNDKKGAFIRSSQNGTTTVTNVEFVWDYHADSVSDTASTVRVKVFGIEMVYTSPTEMDGYLTLGDGDGASTESTRAFHGHDSDNFPVVATTGSVIYANVDTGGTGDDALITTGGGVGIDGYNGLCTDGDSIVENSSFPTGGMGFLLMKYELSQAQYRDFLNTLTRTQQNTRTATQTANYFVMSNNTNVVYKQTIRAPASVGGGTITFGCDAGKNGTFNQIDDGEWKAMNYITWMDLLAYADWASLRPMTELEYEMAGRGISEGSVTGEYAWGTTDLATLSGLSLEYYNTEGYSITGTGAANYGGTYGGPLRTGWAAGALTGRLTAGAGYYGAMDLSGNVKEQCVTIGNATGRAFLGTDGDGALSANGNANQSDWPGYVTSEVTSADGAGLRGGAYDTTSTYLRVSDRYQASAGASTRVNNNGGRLARSYCLTC